jgi:protein arginine kinase
MIREKMSVKRSTNGGRQNDELPAWFTGKGTDADIIVSTRIRIARNLAEYRFPLQASLRERTMVYEKIAAALDGLAQCKALNVVNFSELPLIEQQLLVEKRTASPDLLRTKGDRGVAYDRRHRVNIMINEEDHLRLQHLDSGCRPAESWKVIDAIDERLGKKIDFAYDRRKGFLTSCPTNSGTGLRVSFLLHLPGLVLTRAIDAVLQGASQMGISARGFFGENSEVVGNFFQLSNQATLGAQEGEFIENTHRVVTEVARHERSARERLLNDARLELTDRVYRAYGILRYARTLSTSEFLNIASALRLGCDCELFTDVTIENLNRATLGIMPAHLQRHAEKSLDESELGVVRAERARELLGRKNKKAIKCRNKLTINRRN